MARAQSDRLQREVARLYALPPEEFVSARNQAARSASDDAEATALRVLKKPTKAAALANLLAREDPDRAAALVDLGAGLREAQRNLDGDRLRSLSRQRRELVQELRKQVRTLTDENVSDAVGRQLEDIFQAVLSNEAAATAFAGARISGVPEADETDPFAGVPTGGPGRARKRASGKQARPAPRDELKEARAAERDAAKSARSAQDEAQAARDRVQQQAAEIEEVQERLDRLRSVLSESRKRMRSAEQAAEVAERELHETRVRLAKLDAD